MHPGIFNLLRQHSDDIFKVNSIIISAYLHVNGIENVLNLEIGRHHISENSDDSKLIKIFIDFLPNGDLDFEGLIELFEFVISPSDKIVNGAIYTPKYIREYIADQCIKRSTAFLDQVKIADISCGCGGFLLTAVEKLRLLTNKPFHAIFRENIFGIDITDYSIERAKLLLSLLAIVNGEDQEHFDFNFHIGDSLTFDWHQVSEIDQNGGFDIIIGNPPYVASRNMDSETLRLTQNFEVARTGHPDLYIPFFQIGFELLNAVGILGYITVNTFIKSINGRALRKYFHDYNVKLELINFGGEQVFQDRNTYTCICFLSQGEGKIRYRRCHSSYLARLYTQDFVEYHYHSLNHIDGWNLTNALEINDFLKTIESTGRPFKKLFITKNGIATLKNNVYKFLPADQDDRFYFLNFENRVFPIERSICRDIVNANKLRIPEDLTTKLEKIIFPYTVANGKVTIIPERALQTIYPFTYEYFLYHRDILSTRDKGQCGYEAWYAYGRRQSMNITQYKLFFPHICDRPRFVISQDPKLLFYNGIAVVSEDLQELVFLKKLLETNLFYCYIRATTKDYSSGYISMSRNYLKNFGIYEFTTKEKQEFLESENPEKFIQEKYDVELPDLKF